MSLIGRSREGVGIALGGGEREGERGDGHYYGRRG